MRKAVARLSALKFLGALVGLAYSVSQARVFGATSLVDAYFVAMAGVYMINSLVQGGQLAEVFVPEYLKAKRSRSMREASLLFSAVVTRMLTVVVGLSLLAVLAAPLVVTLLGPGLGDQERALALDMFRWAALMVALTLFSSFVNTTLNAEGVFGRAELTGVASQSVSLALLWSFHDQAGIWILVYSQTVGKFIELGSAAWFLAQKGVRFRPTWNAEGHDLSGFFRVLFATSGYVVATQLFTGTVTACASLLPPGSLSVYNYIKLYCSKFSALLLGPLSTVVFSKLANLAASGHEGLAKALAMPVRSTLLATIAVVACAWMAGRPVLESLLHNPSFDSDKLSLAHEILVWGFFGTILSGTGTLFRKSAISLGLARALYVRWTLAQLVSCGVAFVCIRTLGDAGLAWIMPLNMGLLAWISVKVSSDAGTSLRQALVAVPWNRRWLALAFAVVTLPLPIMALPVDRLYGESIGAAVRLALYLIPLAALGRFFLLPRNASRR